MPKTILLTGASGRIGRCLRFALRDEYRLVLFNRSPIPDLGPTERHVRGDTADAGAVEAAARGVDVILDLAAVSDVAPFREQLLPANILGTYNVFEAARLAGVPRLIYASTYLVVGYYSTGHPIDETTPVRPSSMYAVTKCFGEAMGRLYADKTGLQVICLRLGFFRDRPLEERHLAVWISPGDMARLARAAIEAPPLRFEIVFGVSNNTRCWWDLGRARRVLGYEPQDDAELYAAELLKDPPSAWLERVGRLGGTKCDSPFMP